jgi:hypothetical protein
VALTRRYALIGMSAMARAACLWLVGGGAFRSAAAGAVPETVGATSGPSGRAPRSSG